MKVRILFINGRKCEDRITIIPFSSEVTMSGFFKARVDGLYF